MVKPVILSGMNNQVLLTNIDIILINNTIVQAGCIIDLDNSCKQFSLDLWYIHFY